MELVKKLGYHRAAVETQILETTLRRWGKVGIKRIGKSSRHPIYPDIENDLIKTFRGARGSGMLTTNGIMIREARRIALRQKNADFVGTLSWLSGFKRRHQICYRRNTRVAQKLPVNAIQKIEEFTDELTKLIEIKKYQLDAIANVDETSIFFDSLSIIL